MKNLRCKNLIYAAIILMFLSINFTYGQQPIQTLELSKPIERQIIGGETQAFQFNVKAGFYARAEVEQKNIDVAILLFAPDGKLVIEMDGKDGDFWREAVSCIAEKDGAYRVEIKAYGAADAAGSYTVKLAASVPNDLPL